MKNFCFLKLWGLVFQIIFIFYLTLCKYQFFQMMKTNNTIIIHPENQEQVNIIKAFMKALKIKFDIKDISPYNKEFVTKINKSKKEFERGEYLRADKQDIDKLLGLK